MKNTRYFITLALIATFVLPIVLEAQVPQTSVPAGQTPTPAANSQIQLDGRDKYTLLEPLPCIKGTGQTCEKGVIKRVEINSYISYVYKFSIALAAFLAVIMIIIGGFQYVTTDIPGMKGDAKGKIQNAVGGLVMIFASYLLLKTIDPRLVEINTHLDPVAIPKSQQGFTNSLIGALNNSTVGLKNVNELQANQTKIKNEKANLLDLANTVETYDPDQAAALRAEAATKDAELNNIEKEIVAVRVQALSETRRGLIHAYLNENPGPLIDDPNKNNDTVDYLLQAQRNLTTLYDEAIQEMARLDPEGAARLTQEKALYTELAKNDIYGAISSRNLNDVKLADAQKTYLDFSYNTTPPANVTDPALQAIYFSTRKQIADQMLAQREAILPRDPAARQQVIDNYRAGQTPR